MIRVRKANERGHVNHGWLDSRHSFSFGSYYDPAYMGFGKLRVLNEDRVAPGQGFGAHPHRDMEIISYVVEGALAHKDSMGNSSIIVPGEVQRMSAGTGVVHSEYNHSEREPVHFLQIWIETAKPGVEPGYEQKSFAEKIAAGGLTLVASGDGRDGSLTVGQDVAMYVGKLAEGQTLSRPLGSNRQAWVQAVRGAVELNGQALRAGDGAAVDGDDALRFLGKADSELLVFDLAS